MFGVRAWVGPYNHVLDGGPDPPQGKVNFGGGETWACSGMHAVGIFNKTMWHFIEFLRSLVSVLYCYTAVASLPTFGLVYYYDF